MSERDDEASEEAEVGECGYCHETKEIVAEMNVSATRRGEKLGASPTIALCEACIPKVIAEFRELSAGKTVVEVDLE